MHGNSSSHSFDPPPMRFMSSCSPECSLYAVILKAANSCDLGVVCAARFGIKQHGYAFMGKPLLSPTGKEPKAAQRGRVYIQNTNALGELLPACGTGAPHSTLFIGKSKDLGTLAGGIHHKAIGRIRRFGQHWISLVVPHACNSFFFGRLILPIFCIDAPASDDSLRFFKFP